MERTALVLAAGLGSRYGGQKQWEGFGPNRRPLLEYALSDGMRHGIGRAVCVIREENRSAAEAALAPISARIPVTLIAQDPFDIPGDCHLRRSKPWGTAHAVYAARNAIDSSFVVLNADDYYGSAVWDELDILLHAHPSDSALVAYFLGNTLSARGPVSRGICTFAGERLISVEEFFQLIRGEDGATYDRRTGKVFQENTPVSMNFWHLPREIFDFLEVAAANFFSQPEEVLGSAEWGLSTALGGLISESGLPVWGRTTATPWCGVTHPHDRAAVNRLLSERNPDFLR